MGSDHGRRARRAGAALALVLALLLGGGAVAAAAADDDFTVAPATPRTGQTVTFTPTLTDDPKHPVTGIAWAFGDGTTATTAPSSPAATHAYATAGTKTVTMTVTRTGGGRAEPVSHDVTVTAAAPSPLRASFSHSPDVPLPGQPVAFDASDSTGPAGGGLGYAWDFGDGSGGDGAAPTHAYTSSGDFTVTLTVTAADGATATDTESLHVDVLPQPALALTIPDLRPGQDPATPIAGQPVVVGAQGSADPDGSIASYAWDLGDGAFGSPGPSPWVITSFAQPGARRLRVQVTDDRGATAVASLPIRVDAPPVAGFAVAPSSPHAGATVTLTSSASDPDGAADIATTSWDLDGDGAFGDATGTTATTTFVAAGEHTVAQRVTDRDGATATAFQTIAVGAGASSPPQTAGAPTSATGDRTTARRTLRLLRGVRLHLAGTITGRRTTLTAVSIMVPKGVTIRVRCAGHGCPASFRRHALRHGSVRLSPLLRTFRARARVTVLVTKRGYVAKRIRVRFRDGKPPLRVERCMMPRQDGGRTRATRCPAG